MRLLLSLALAASAAGSAPVRRSSAEAAHAWLQGVYPDDSASWPKGAASSLEVIGAGWDFVARGALHDDGVPVAVLLRFGEGELVTGVRVLRWQGRWTEALRLRDDGTGLMNAKRYDLAGRKLKGKVAGFLVTLLDTTGGEGGLWLGLTPAGWDGRPLGEPKNLYWSKLGKHMAEEAY